MKVDPSSKDACDGECIHAGRNLESSYLQKKIRRKNMNRLIHFTSLVSHIHRNIPHFSHTLKLGLLSQLNVGKSEDI